MPAHDPIPPEQMDAAHELHDDPARIREVEAELLDAIQSHGYREASVFAIRLSFEEAVLNALRHGHKELPGAPVTVRWKVTHERITLRVEDEGPGFAADDLPDPTAPENLEQPHGRGVMLMRAYMTRVSFNDRGNIVTLEYDNDKPDEDA